MKIKDLNTKLRVKFRSHDGKTYWKNVKTINLGSCAKPTRGIVAVRIQEDSD